MGMEHLRVLAAPGAPRESAFALLSLDREVMRAMGSYEYIARLCYFKQY